MSFFALRPLKSMLIDQYITLDSLASSAIGNVICGSYSSYNTHALFATSTQFCCFSTSQQHHTLNIIGSARSTGDTRMLHTSIHPGLVPGHDPTRESAPGGLEMSWSGPGRLGSGRVQILMGWAWSGHPYIPLADST